jgi:serine/threonine-protein kinase RsbT
MAQITSYSPIKIPIVKDDVYAVVAAQEGRKLAAQLGFSAVEQTAICTAILEVARNIVRYADQGEVVLDVVQNGDTQQIVVVAHDHGPGIADIDLALQEGYTTGQGLGLGLPGARRLVDEFEIHSHPDRGTTIIMRKGKGKV